MSSNTLVVEGVILISNSPTSSKKHQRPPAASSHTGSPTLVHVTPNNTGPTSEPPAKRAAANILGALHTRLGFLEGSVGAFRMEVSDVQNELHTLTRRIMSRLDADEAARAHVEPRPPRQHSPLRSTPSSTFLTQTRTALDWGNTHSPVAPRAPSQSIVGLCLSD
ncbi:hypothetical protein BDZ89DRAFT_1125885 [Hymenopellis radicata]|nr:hypothetical protein BDZ89DRAFT_1125885 [Hymenopellis radicata]